MPSVSFDIPTLPFADAGLIFAVLTVAILLAPLIARLTRLPEVVTAVVVGFAIGPTGIGLLERSGVVATLGSAGLLYLMFVAGLELDLDDFIEHRRDSIGFGVATFVIPMTLGTGVALGLGFELLASLLLASCWASHTLITYPVFQRVGTVGNRAVATSVGATIITDTAALLVLAVVARAFQGALTPVFWLTLLPSMALLTAAAVLVLPRLARWFFSGAGQQRGLRFVFVLVVLFVLSSLFQVIGVEAIVGAFLAGLSLNRSVPNGGLLMERIDFVGATIFIPIFLIATGMLIDLQVLADPRTLLVGVSFTVVAIVAKLLAAIVAGRLYGYSRDEIGAMFSLTSAQAAATLAAIIVGLQVGLIGQDTVNAVILVIVVTCVLASLTAGWYAAHLPRPEQERAVGEMVVVPVANPATAPRLMKLASAFARADGGLVIPVLVVSNFADGAELARARALDTEVLAVAQSAGSEARSVLRIDSSPELGIAHTVLEQQGSMLVLGWKGRTGARDALFGGITDRVLSSTFVPTVIAREGTTHVERILLAVDETVVSPAGIASLRLAVRTAAILSQRDSVPVEVVTNRDDPELTAAVDAELGVGITLDPRRRSILVKNLARPTDLIIVPSIADEPNLRAVAVRVMRASPDDASVLVCVDNSLADPAHQRVSPGATGYTVTGEGPLPSLPS
jgi:Kef-type K+ transport system membrane component KefB